MLWIAGVYESLDCDWMRSWTINSASIETHEESNCSQYSAFLKYSVSGPQKIYPIFANFHGASQLCFLFLWLVVWLVCFSKEANYKFQQRRNEYCGNIHKHWSGEVYSTMTVLAQNLTQQSVWKFCVGTVRIKKLDRCFSFWFCLLPMASVVLRKGKRQSFRKYRAHKK